MFWNIIIAVASYFLNLVLAPKPQNAKPASLEDFDIPTAEEGIEIPVVFGTVNIRNPNVMWYGDFDSDAIKGARRYGFFGPRQITGYQYQIGMHMILCHGCHDAVRNIWAGEKLLWSESADGLIYGSTSIAVDQPDLFGGEDREGGIWGQVDFMDGNPGQGQNDYLVNKLGVGAITPAFRGVVSVVWRRGGADQSGLHIGTNPYVKPWEFQLSRIHRTSEGATQWYDDYAAVPESNAQGSYGPGSQRIIGTGGGVTTGWTSNNPRKQDTNGDYIAVIKDFGGLYVWHLPDCTLQTYSLTGLSNIESAVYITDYAEILVRQDHNLVFRSAADAFNVLQSIDVAPYCAAAGVGSSNAGFTASQYGDWLIVKLISAAYISTSVREKQPYLVLHRSGSGWSVTASHASVNEIGGISMGAVYAYGQGANYKIIRVRWNGAWEETAVDFIALSGTTDTSPSLQNVVYFAGTDEVVTTSDYGKIYVFDAALTVLRRSTVFTEVSFDFFYSGGRMAYSSSSILICGQAYATTPPSNGYIYEVRVSDLMIKRRIVLAQTSYVDNVVGALFWLSYFKVNRQHPGAFMFEHWENGDWWPVTPADGLDMNPAHIIRECLTDMIWGMGYNAVDIDDDSFMSAAQTFYDECFGLSLQWNREEKIEEFISVILAHVDAYLYLRRTTGKFYLKPIRDDYVLDSLPVFDEDDVVTWDEVARREPAEAINSVIVKYTDRKNRGKDASHQVDNIAQIQQLGERISATRFYPGISRGSLAVQVAGRDQRSLGIGLISGRVTGKRTFDLLYPGDPFRLVSSRQNLDGEIMRVASMKFGDGRDNKITVQFVEDVFRLGAPDLVDTAQGDWEIVANPPAAVYPRLVWEAPYWHLRALAGPSDTAAILLGNPDAGALVMAGGKPTSDSIDAKVYVNGVAEDTLGFAPAGTLGLPIAPLDTAVTLDNKTGTFTVGALAAIVGSTGPQRAEIVQILTVAGADLTLSRGLVDTIPKNHAAGDSFVVFDGFSVSDFNIRDDSETPAVRLLTRTSRAMLKYDVAPEDVVDMDSRAIRPLRPANVRVEGLPIGPVDGIGLPNFDVSWAERNRLVEVGTPLAWTDATSVTEEAGQDTVIEVLDSDKIVVHTQTVPSGTTTYSVPAGWFTDPIGWIRVGSERDGYREWQAYAIEVYTEEIDFLTLDADELTLGGESIYFA